MVRRKTHYNRILLYWSNNLEFLISYDSGFQPPTSRRTFQIIYIGTSTRSEYLLLITVFLGNPEKIAVPVPRSPG